MNKIKSRIVFKIRTGYKLELLTKETMKLLGSSKKKYKDKNGENVPKSDYVDTALMHCNLVSSNYQQASKVLITFVPDKNFGQLIIVEPKSLTMLKTLNAEFSFIEVYRSK